VANKLREISDELIVPNQNALIKGVFILDFFVSTHGIIHDAIQNKDVGLSLSSILKKLMVDRVGRDFMVKMLIHT
jgi:hypothetical protein